MVLPMELMHILDYKIVLLGALAIMNMVGFALMGIDKYKAKKHAWRISEKTLFLVALLGGGAGSWAGMYVFSHKTKHWYFVIGMPVITVLELALLIFAWVFSNLC